MCVCVCMYMIIKGIGTQRFHISLEGFQREHNVHTMSTQCPASWTRPLNTTVFNYPINNDSVVTELNSF